MLFRRSPPVQKTARPASGEVVEIDGSPVRLRVNARARRFSLRMDARRGEVALVLPDLSRLPDALDFARSRSGWIAERLAEAPRGGAFAPGQMLEVEGEPYRLERAAMRIPPTFRLATADEPARLIASGADPASFARSVERGLRDLARARLQKRTARHCRALCAPEPRLSLQDARTRWGSCRQASPDRPAEIRYNWRLVLAPPEVLDYVAAHECAHLLEANHGPRFWALVRRLYGDPAPARAWLKANGARLHAAGR